MKCNDLHNKIIFFLDAELPVKEMQEIKLHLAECAECNAFTEEMKKTFKILSDEKRPEVNPFFYTRVKAKLEKQLEAKKGFVLKPALVKILQPAFFSILLIAGIYTGIKIGQPVPKPVGFDTDIQHEIVPYLNEMETETIELFLME